MQRYFVEFDLKLNQEFQITGADVHHMRNVMRFSMGEQVAVCNAGKCYLCDIVTVDAKCVTLLAKEFLSNNELPVNVDIAQALIRRERFEYMMQKAVELGARKIIPMVARNNVVKINPNKEETKKRRWEAILKEASEQSQRTIKATIGPTTKLVNLPFKQYDKVIVAYEKEAGSKTLTSVFTKELNNILLVIGPEGGFSDAEITYLKTIPNVSFVGLGKRILRSETAPLFLLSVIGYLYELEGDK
jgi:16S rRNA (uracil1498-N3)-methyltransferase